MSSVTTSVKRAFRQPAFIVAVLVLGLCAATLNTAIAFLTVHFKKLPVPLRVNSLREGIPHQLGPWVMVSIDEAIRPDIEHALGTREYIFRDYVDTRHISQIDIDKMKSATADERAAILNQLRTDRPNAVMRAAVTYYTGLVDTVAHVPERCFVADGYEIKESDVKDAALGNFTDGKPRKVKYSFLNFEDQSGIGLEFKRTSCNVGYVFHCNGSYAASPFEVRVRLQNLFEKYGYYAKVELMTAAPLTAGFEHGIMESNERRQSVQAVEDFLSVLLPQVEKCMPDWQELHKKP